MSRAKPLGVLVREYSVTDDIKIIADESWATNSEFKRGQAYIKINTTFQGLATPEKLRALAYSIKEKIEKNSGGYSTIFNAKHNYIDVIFIDNQENLESNIRERKEKVGSNPIIALVGNDENKHIRIYLPTPLYAAPHPNQNANWHSLIGLALSQITYEDLRYLASATTTLTNYKSGGHTPSSAS